MTSENAQPDAEATEVNEKSQSSTPNFLQNFVGNVEALRKSTPFVSEVTETFALTFRREYLEEFKKSESLEIRLAEYLGNLPIQKRADILESMNYSNSLERTASRLPSLMLTAIIAETEVLFAEMIKWSFKQKPQIMRSIDKKISIVDLDGAKNVEELKDLLIDQEIEEILRLSPKEQIKKIESSFNVDISSAFNDFPSFLEIFERRNIIMHSGGKASRQYINSLKKISFPKEKIPKLNEELTIDSKYFRHSSEELLNFGSLAGFRLWWKFAPSLHRSHDGWLINQVYTKISDQEYSNAMNFIEMVERMNYRFSEDSSKYQFIINKAQCHKWMKNNNECQKTLNSIDWSGVADNFKLCVHVLKNEFEEAVKLVSRIGNNGDIDFNGYCQWPIFQEIREDEDFKIKIKSVFGKEFESFVKTQGIFNSIMRRSSHKKSNAPKEAPPKLAKPDGDARPRKRVVLVRKIKRPQTH